MIDETIPTEQVLAIDGVLRRTKNTDGLGSKGALTLSVDDDFSLDGARAIIDLIHGDLRLLFFDGDHPQRSDPGLYCFLQRIDGQLHVQGANHGWSYPWQEISDDTAARWLWLCKAYNGGTGAYDSSVMRIRRSVPVDLDEPAGTYTSRVTFNDWLRARLAP